MADQAAEGEVGAVIVRAGALEEAQGGELRIIAQHVAELGRRSFVGHVHQRRGMRVEHAEGPVRGDRVRFGLLHGGRDETRGALGHGRSGRKQGQQDENDRAHADLFRLAALHPREET